MRLDEWQKYIDTQFLDDSPEPTSKPATIPAASIQPPAAPAGQTVLPLDAAAIRAESSSSSLLVPASALINAPDSHTHTSLLSEAAQNNPSLPPVESHSAQTEDVFSAHIDVPDPALPLSASAQEADTAFPEPALSITHSVFTLVVTPPPAPVPSNRPPRIELLTPLPAAPAETALPGAEVINKTRRRSQARTAQQNTPTAPSNADANQTVSAPTIPPDKLFQPLNDLGADIPEFARYLPSSHAAAPAKTQLLVSEPSAPPMAQTLPQPADAEFQSPEPPRHIPRSRARHARNVRPETILSGSSAAELWAAVPRHVQTLLSLERVEEQNEIAQSSYKRPFQEKRHELIERLLDPILSLEDTARLLNVCPTTVRRYTNKGILTYYRKDTHRSVNSSDAADTSEQQITDKGAEEKDTAEKETAEKETRQRRFRLSDILAFLETQQSAIGADYRAERRVPLDSPAAQDNGSTDAVTTGAAKDA